MKNPEENRTEREYLQLTLQPRVWNEAEKQWWRTFNAALSMPLEEGETIPNPCLTATYIARDAHGFIPSSYKGDKPEDGKN